MFVGLVFFISSVYGYALVYQRVIICRGDVSNFYSCEGIVFGMAFKLSEVGISGYGLKYR